VTTPKTELDGGVEVEMDGDHAGVSRLQRMATAQSWIMASIQNYLEPSNPICIQLALTQKGW
jgi:hypothetical protein